MPVAAGPVPARLSAIVAVDRGLHIGKDGGLPWRLGTDLARFKRLTTGHAIVMGRKTFRSLGRLLPDRRHVVLTRDRGFSFEGVEVVHDLAAALRSLASDADPFVIGGGEIYREFWPFLTDLHLTRVETLVDGDTTFPALDDAVWTRVGDLEAVPAGPRDDFPSTYEHLRRRR